ncbi:lantibiotic immunity ABC transporter MutG family permease subunit [Oceanobacillus sp. J11TS1]|uniref:lantibiotic immunity ABC transporter MutG family permease subunit n=1 Tax=Oceanobacillus sp. J11TS1 TaxID=2807191 RepID=UPI001B235312|nr:lantibiotic immunity ABC transporter MutG family permease subunit [Oceanobacillus sp. J11TS1]GIO25220.1 multidrug ABC transporter permease [Oceanobacillus sp. J11TS1]
MLWRCLQADFLKMKHTPFVWIHLLIAFMTPALFILYFRFGHIPNDMYLYAGFMEAITIGLPLLIGILCGMVAIQEENAGKYRVLLTGTLSRTILYLSKLAMLLIFAFLAVFCSVAVYVVGLRLVLHISAIPYIIFLQGATWIVAASIILYMIHLFVSLRFGMGASVFLGGAGVLVSALMLTGLGDLYWKYIPWAWGGRFVDSLAVYRFSHLGKGIQSLVRNEMETGTVILMIVTFALFISSLGWFNRWEGRKSFE